MSAAHKGKARRMNHFVKRGQVARIGQRVQADQLILRVPPHLVLAEVRADKPGAAG